MGIFRHCNAWLPNASSKREIMPIFDFLLFLTKKLKKGKFEFF